MIKFLHNSRGAYTADCMIQACRAHPRRKELVNHISRVIRSRQFLSALNAMSHTNKNKANALLAEKDLLLKGRSGVNAPFIFLTNDFPLVVRNQWNICFLKYFFILTGIDKVLMYI